MRDRSKQDRVSGTVLPATPTAVVSRWYPILILCRKINRYKDDDDDDISVADTTWYAADTTTTMMKSVTSAGAFLAPPLW